MISAPYSRHPDAVPPAQAADERRYYNIAQAAALLGVSRMSIWRWIRAGRLPVARLGHRTSRIRREDLESLLAERGSATSQPRGVSDRGAVAQGPNDGDAPHADWRAMGASAHFVQFYEADATLLDAVGEYIGAGIGAGETGIVIATGAHRAGLEERLRAAGLDMDAARADGRYVALDAAETLARFMADGEPEPARFAEVVGAVVAVAAEGGRRVRAFGEMVALLAVAGEHAAAVRLEALWNGLQQVHTFSLFCAYPLDALDEDALAMAFGDICTEHAGVIPAEGYTGLADPEARLRIIAALQQKAASLEVEVAARKLAEERLRRSERELRDFFENATEGLHWVGEDGRILWANRAEYELLGYTADEYIGRPITDFHADPEVIADILRRLSAGEELHGYEARLRARDGSIKHVLINSNVYREDGRFVHTRWFTRDITERTRAAHERESLLAREQDARAVAEAALRLRDAFLSIASHELRTPIATLKGHAQVALRRLERTGQLEPERAAEALRTIARQSDKLNRLLGHLLDISRLEAGKLTLEPRPTDISALAGQVVADARARDDRHDIALAAPPRLEAEIDPLRLEQVLVNLLDNAIKYSPNGGAIEVAVSRAAADALEISVRDRGLGVPPEKRARIFERFYQAHGEGHRSGLGLGLYISGQIIELHGGEIRAVFPPDGGSRFVVRLPLALEMGRRPISRARS